MRYKNIKTGFVFETEAKIEGADWVLMDESKKVEPKKDEPKETKKAPKKQTKKKVK